MCPGPSCLVVRSVLELGCAQRASRGGRPSGLVQDSRTFLFPSGWPCGGASLSPKAVGEVGTVGAGVSLPCEACAVALRVGGRGSAGS